MNSRWIRAPFQIAGLIALALIMCPPAFSEDGQDKDEHGRVMLQFAPDVYHYHSKPEHAKWSWLIGGEYIWPSRYLVGFSYFNNSFNQKCQTLYGGYFWPLSGTSSRYWYFKAAAGVILGYDEPYENKLPYNHNGIAPGLVPALGYQYDRFNAQLNILGTSGLMITFGYDVYR